MEKKLYWLVEGNTDLSFIVRDIFTAYAIMDADFKSYKNVDKKQIKYTITANYLTEEEYLIYFKKKEQES